MKKMLSVLLALIMVLSLAACGAKEPVGVTITNNLGYDIEALWAGVGANDNADVDLGAPLANGESITIMVNTICEGPDGIIDLEAFDVDGDYYYFDDLDVKDGNTISLEWGEEIAAIVSGKDGDVSFAGYYESAAPVQGGEQELYYGFWAYDNGMTIAILDDGTWAQFQDGSRKGSAAYAYDGSGITLLDNDGNQAQYLLYEDGSLVDTDGDYLEATEEPVPTVNTTVNSLTFNIGGNATVESAKDGKLKLMDKDLKIGAKFNSDLLYSNQVLDKALLVSDGANGYCIGRNMTNAYLNFAGSDEEFANAYIAQYLLNDFATLYGECTAMSEPVHLMLENNSFVCRVEMRMVSGEAFDIYFRLFVGEYAYSNGQPCYIAKATFAPYGNQDQFDAMSGVSIYVLSDGSTPKPSTSGSSSGSSSSGASAYYYYDEDGDLWYWNGYDSEFIGFGDDYYTEDGEYYESNDWGWDYGEWSDPGDYYDDYYYEDDYYYDDGYGDYFDDGYSDGYGDVFDDGYSDGYGDVFDDGYSDGYGDYFY